MSQNENVTQYNPASNHPSGSETLGLVEDVEMNDGSVDGTVSRGDEDLVGSLQATKQYLIDEVAGLQRFLYRNRYERLDQSPPPRPGAAYLSYTSSTVTFTPPHTFYGHQRSVPRPARP